MKKNPNILNYDPYACVQRPKPKKISPSTKFLHGTSMITTDGYAPINNYINDFKKIFKTFDSTYQHETDEWDIFLILKMAGVRVQKDKQFPFGKALGFNLNEFKSFEKSDSWRNKLKEIFLYYNNSTPENKQDRMNVWKDAMFNESKKTLYSNILKELNILKLK